MKRISVYTSSGEIAASAYYRFYQYLKSKSCIVKYRKKISDKMYSKRMPISKSSLPIKIWCWIVLYLRGLKNLILDNIITPDILIISRGILPKFFPLSYYFLINRLFNKTNFIWDFDDNILAVNEISQKKFDWFSKHAKYIIVASEYNKQMIKEEWRYKCKVLPTTDGDLFKLYNSDLFKQRLHSYENKINLIWLGSATSLEYLSAICPQIEKFSIAIKQLGKEVELLVVCNKPLNYMAKNFTNTFIKWSRNNAINEMKRAHIGIMPLANTEFTKGKGGFKLIQYLSIGLPVIGSKVGINDTIIDSDSGYKIDNLDSPEWNEALYKISSSRDEYKTKSIGAYNNWMNNYSFDKNKIFWDNIINNL